MHPVAHFKTITEHRRLVRQYCFRLGLIRQGLTHDLSKYSPTEFRVGAKYYRGYESPNDAERKATGISMAWLHHKGRNRHHFEYWVDYQLEKDGRVRYAGQRMPLRYIAEMFCDRVAASRIYLKDKYCDASAWEYFQRGRGEIPMHPDTDAELEKMLEILKDEGEDAAFAYIRERLKRAKREGSF